MAIKSYTDLEQSKVLAKILPLESADMIYYACVKDWRGNSIEPKWGKPTTLTKEELALPRSNFQEYEYLLCWSLAALLGVLPKIHGLKPILDLEECSIQYSGIDLYITASNPIDACYEMIIKLNELNLL